MIKQSLANSLSINIHSISFYKVLKKSLDARSKIILCRLKIEAYINEPTPDFKPITRNYKNVSKSKNVIIIGAGPAGLFCALSLIEQGIKPIILERGKDVRSRRFDLANINRKGIVNENSNYCFGEGGAGTYSDGKLYTRSNKRGNINHILETLVLHGANPDILVEAHPHIGSNKLPKVIENIRNTILNHGGEIHFQNHVTDFLLNENKIKSVITACGKEYFSNKFVLAVGHSSRDIFYLLAKKNIRIEAKPFALGVRIEHPQQIIDTEQYHCETRADYLPPAAYSLSTQVLDRGVFSFCMCPGGFIVPAATNAAELVINGMSLSNRGSAYANSGTVVSVELEDLATFAKQNKHIENKNLLALEFQKSVEQVAFKFGGGSQVAPSQRLTDFVENKLSNNLPKCSYKPGVNSVLLSEVLPSFIFEKLRLGIKDFSKKMKNYFTNEAIVLATESRTSSPVSIPRDRIKLSHSEVINLFPTGEGAGYAGGIISAAIDGIRVAESIANEFA